ncbi:hypothetical protein Cri9333_0962 [Crinalium epipsammum PCC 9333]|uniref:Uncharacterized protein n=1 Tax=Crinalium epipsammum PCC 9333 TaxID=1173022 RepID=K9VWK9_9CYAN|nr:hypothetical protein [Crinalium epipsammum]AFZ11877.1 hypothetical protein Cri9333_0962 [Crinalium epipsammum PCC 9333]
MLKTVKGIYRNGKIELNEVPENIAEQTPVIITFITETNSTDSENPITTYHDLDFLAGTWTADDETEFLSNTNDFNKIDKNLWQ